MLLKDIASELKRTGSVSSTAESLGISRHALRRFIISNSKIPYPQFIEKHVGVRDVKQAAREGRLGFDPVLPGFETHLIKTQYDESGGVKSESIAQRIERPQKDFEMPEGHVLSGISHLGDGNGRTILQWNKTKPGIDPKKFVENLIEAFKDFEPAAPVRPVPDIQFADLLTLYPIPDLHIGMFAWRGETPENWDLKIAEKTIWDIFTRVLATAPDSDVAVFLGGGDAMHSDNNDNMTAKSKNILQVDGRYDKILAAVEKLFVRMIDMMLTKHKKVHVRILRGNHDEHASVAISHFLAAYYRNESRVVVDTDASLFWAMRYGRTLLTATHGHATKWQNMPNKMAALFPKDWGETDFRFAHVFHVHHRNRVQAKENDGAIVETFQVPIPPDSWHYGASYGAGRSMCWIAYSKDGGEEGRWGKSVPQSYRLAHVA